jgi:hypothetical protein
MLVGSDALEAQKGRGQDEDALADPRLADLEQLVACAWVTRARCLRARVHWTWASGLKATALVVLRLVPAHPSHTS